MIKTYKLEKGSNIVIKCHAWGIHGEIFYEEVNTKLDEDIVLRCRDVLNKNKLHQILRKKYGVVREPCSRYFYYYDVVEC